MTIQQSKITGKQSLISSPTPELDVSVLLQFITGFDKTQLLMNRNYELSAEQQKWFDDAVEKRKTGLPVAYITHEKEFFGLTFYVDENVLIPKPDTELLVELACGSAQCKVQSAQLMVLDMCSGSGCVGISLAHELLEKGFSDFSMTFADISPAALDVTKRNAKELLRTKRSPSLNFVQSNLFDSISDSFDLIVTNPPYVPHVESLELLTDGRSEPLLALDGDVDSESNYCGTSDGLSLIRRLVPQCYEHLNHGGKLIMETGEYNAEETAELFKAAGFKNVHIEKDMNDMLRDVCGDKE